MITACFQALQPVSKTYVGDSLLLTKPRYVIITPAFNESANIEKTIISVLKQSHLPDVWFIVDDDSTDETGDIIRRYAAHHEFICYHHRKKPAGQAYYASNVSAIMEGYAALDGRPFSYLAILDADIVLPDDYYELLLKRFEEDSSLGVASGVYENLVDGKPQKALHDRRSTPKNIQVFRAETFQQIGGFLPLPYGGEDTISCVMARMAGWKAWSFPDLKALHLRPTGTGQGKDIVAARFAQGICEYNLAVHPLFFLLKVVRRMLIEKPYLVGGLARLAGYGWAGLRGDKTMVPENVVSYYRKEQLSRVFNGNRITS